MGSLLNVLRLLMVVGWVAATWLAVEAYRKAGLEAAFASFLDGSDPWQAQFNADFGFHLLLVAAWLIYRARTWWLGVVWAVLAISTGGMFTFAYVLIVSLQVKGNVRALLLGRHATAA